jgi:hypothetical protein
MFYWDISIVKVTRSLGAQFRYEAYWQTFSLGGLYMVSFRNDVRNGDDT